MTFTYRSARSGALLGGIVLAIVVETVMLHLLVTSRHPIVGWALTVGSIATIAWLVADYRALGNGFVRLDGERLDLRVGRRFVVTIPTTAVASAVRPTWRDLPVRGTPAGATYLNLMKPAAPNVLLTLSTPAVVNLPGGLRRSARQLGLCLDAPDEFLSALHRSTALVASSAATSTRSR